MDEGWKIRIRDGIKRLQESDAEFAKRANIKSTMLADIFRKTQNPRIDTISNIANALGVSVSWLLTGKDEFHARVPIVGVVAAGEGWTEQPDDSLEFVDFTLGGDDMIAVEIHGDSMLPTY